jgi:hypothetical protein
MIFYEVIKDYLLFGSYEYPPMMDLASPVVDKYLFKFKKYRKILQACHMRFYKKK